MPNYYRRADIAGGTHFVTINTFPFRRLPGLIEKPVRNALREAIRHTQIIYPFDIDAWFFCPIICIASGRCLKAILIFPFVGQRSSVMYRKHPERSLALRLCPNSRENRREFDLWQRRFWKHPIRGENDFARHADYVHWNSVKHGLAAHTGDWPYSTFHWFVRG